MQVFPEPDFVLGVKGERVYFFRFVKASRVFHIIVNVFGSDGEFVVITDTENSFEVPVVVFLAFGEFFVTYPERRVFSVDLGDRVEFVVFVVVHVEVEREVGSLVEEVFTT